ncbi:MAG: hypothetical protein EB072_06780 [Betaproteobacteria bacterium]|nr:hypothetical protein [Betaproteobacteria bacterium]
MAEKIGTSGADSLYGTDGADLIRGEGGDDLLRIIFTSIRKIITKH